MATLLNNKSAKLSSKISTSTPCPLCKRRNTLRIDIHATYKHICNLPTHATGKTVDITCEACGYEFHAPYMPQDFKNEYAELDQKTKIPLYYSLGRIAGAATILGASFFVALSFCL